MKSFYTINIYGQHAVNAGYAFCKSSCYRQIQTHGKRIGQLEVVVDEPGQYNGYDNKWVSVAYIENGSNVEKALNALSKIGFSGCKCYVALEENVDSDFVQPEKVLFCCII